MIQLDTNLSHLTGLMHCHLTVSGERTPTLELHGWKLHDIELEGTASAQIDRMYTRYFNVVGSKEVSGNQISSLEDLLTLVQNGADYLTVNGRDPVRVKVEANCGLDDDLPQGAAYKEIHAKLGPLDVGQVNVVTGVVNALRLCNINIALSSAGEVSKRYYLTWRFRSRDGDTHYRSVRDSWSPSG